MPVDLEYLRRHYASLSDEGLLAIERADLVAAAQKCYDDEMKQRNLDAPRASRRAEPREQVEQAQVWHEEYEESDAPEWLDDAAEVYSANERRGAPPPDDMMTARDALDAAGIPNHLDLFTTPGEGSDDDHRRWRLMVPGELNLHATSVLEREISNVDFEEGWRAHLETLSDEEVRAMDVEAYFCGLFDRVERVKSVFKAELASRGIKR